MKRTALNFDKLRQHNVIRCESAFHKLNEWSPTDWMTAVAGEAGEAANLIKKLRRLDTEGEDAPANVNVPARDQLKPLIADELADTVIYIDLLAARLGIDLGEAVVSKFNRTSAKVKSAITLDE